MRSLSTRGREREGVMEHHETQRMLADIHSHHITDLVFGKIARLAERRAQLEDEFPRLQAQLDVMRISTISRAGSTSQRSETVARRDHHGHYCRGKGGGCGEPPLLSQVVRDRWEGNATSEQRCSRQTEFEQLGFGIELLHAQLAYRYGISATGASMLPFKGVVRWLSTRKGSYRRRSLRLSVAFLTLRNISPVSRRQVGFPSGFRSARTGSRGCCRRWRNGLTNASPNARRP